MSKVFCIIGKSGTGKDALYKKILYKKNNNLMPIIPYTTRPKRHDEVEGVNYHFVTEEQMLELKEDGLILEKRDYNTMNGIWSYFTVKFDLLTGMDYITITTLDGVFKLIEHYGNDMIQVVYLHLEDQQRLLRCINREAIQGKPNFSEVCRRYLADEMDFSPERLSLIENIYAIDTSMDINCCIKQIQGIIETL